MFSDGLLNNRMFFKAVSKFNTQFDVRPLHFTTYGFSYIVKKTGPFGKANV